MNHRPPRAVLIVEDESIIAHDIRQILVDLGYDACGIASSAEEAMARAAEKRPDIALVDIRIRGKLDGIKTAQILQQSFGIPIVYLTAHADDVTVERAARTHPYGYLLKPVKPSELKGTIEIAVQSHAMDTRGEPRPAGPAAVAPRPTAADVTGIAVEACRQLQLVLQSDDFDASRRSRDFLLFIVNETLAGRGDALTQAAIATKVFGRNDNFDPVVDPIVRIQAGRLRRSLERYYLLSGKSDSVRIELPRGSYVPVFDKQAPAEGAGLPAPEKEPLAPAPANDWPQVLLRPLETAGLSPDQADLAAGWYEELAAELGRNRDVRLVREADREAAVAAAPPVRLFALSTSLWSVAGGLDAAARLVESASGEQLWADAYPATSRSGSLEDVARVIAARVGAEEGVVVQWLASERRKSRPAAIMPYGAMLLSYEFFLTRDPQMLPSALEALRRAVTMDPNSAPLWTRLGRVCFANYAFEVTPIATPIEQAIDYAQTGVRLDPTSRRARCILAAALLVKGELEAARDELEQALRLSPGSLVYLEIIGLFLTLLGDERGPAVIRTARERNPHALTNALMGLWFDHLRRGEIELAYQCALEYRDPTFFWRGVMRASCLGLLGRTADAEVEAAEMLLQRKPDFVTRGRILIGHLIKFPDVTSLIVDGLARAGLRL